MVYGLYPQALKIANAGTCPLSLCQYVLGALSTLGSGPVDVLAWVLDIACLAVNAAVIGQHEPAGAGGSVGNLLLGIDLEPHPQFFALILDVFVDACRAEPVLDALVLGPLHLGMLLPVLHLEMNRLVLLVICSTSADAG